MHKPVSISMVKYLVLLCVVITTALCSFSFYQKNNIPVVTIAAPVNGSAVTHGNAIAYKIEVTDKEDGTTKYEEIQSGEIFMKLKYVSSVKEINAYIQKENQGEKVFVLMKQNNCFTCHSVHQKLSGPSFRDIALKYGAAAATYEKLSEKIINGSRGVWNDSQQMPAHPELNKQQAIALASLVIQYGNEKDFEMYTGAEGTIRSNKNMNKPVLLLIASYLDHGIELVDRKEGKSMVKVNLK
ncbi:MAG: hypothetical protein QM802_26810 [Agriterribacter sp.]